MVEDSGVDAQLVVGDPVARAQPGGVPEHEAADEDREQDDAERADLAGDELVERGERGGRDKHAAADHGRQR